MLTAELQLDSLQQELTDALVPLEPKVVEARQTIQRYVLTLSEQARQAAEKAREAKERTDTRANSQPETAEQLADKQQEAERATRATLESLVDLANTAEVRDAEQRELALKNIASQTDKLIDVLGRYLDKPALGGGDETSGEDKT